MSDWKGYGDRYTAGPSSAFGAGFKAILVLMVAATLLGILGKGCGWFSEAAQVAREEFGPRELLRKYEWFKDAAAQLDKKRADMKVYDARLGALAEAYKGKSRGEWPRDDREQSSIWMSEAAGIRASYNTLAADYNAQMAKFNWRFCEAGRLPEGASEPLPREFKPYEEK